MSQREVFLAAQRTIAMVLAGGRGKRLHDLTRRLSKPGLAFGGKYRIIDFTMSNCVNSNIRKILVVTQYNSHSLLEHLQFGWTFLNGKFNEFIHVLPAQQSLESDAWYSGTADAVYQNLETIGAHRPENVLVLAGDHIYKMDYRRFLEDHLEKDADLTIACLEVPLADAREFGVAEADASDRIVSFVEKPQQPTPVPGRPGYAFASMGIYLFKADFLYAELARDAADPTSSHDFGKDVIPYLVPRARVYAHRFNRSHIRNMDKPPYWRDVGTVDAYWEANMDLTNVDPDLNLYDYDWPIFTHQEQLPAAKFVHSGPHRNGVAISSLVSAGCIVSGATVHRSLLFSKVRVHSHAYLHEAVVLPGADIEEHARLHRVIVDRNCRVPIGLVVGEDPEEDARRFHRTPGGVTLISQRMLDNLQEGR
ncbi:glucose-1-phosphate adenylyltransferase [Mesoterricola silvestris]|uniref:Glucose-1-phosphate adenylyltransferase n=1 Tax=Mesoterricola silvestris TaxID=2927979 RepID=A0AA48GGR4_9BACT|nr:glucose-1-phosphate adenylyltransferase [Mesoterricola silvestris]BDU72521.1 glucose-1-phosphate adenylyltransferase [Mesoterricola silvestris]